MARKSKTLRSESISGRYAAIPWVVIDSDSFKGASDKAKALLFALMRQHNGSNNGHLHLAKKWLYNQGWTCHENNTKARKELIERGLIVQTKWGGLNMGPDLFAVTWYDISNYIGLDITAKGYSRGAYYLCNLPPTARRKPPIKSIQNNQKTLPNDRTSPVPTIVPMKQSTGTATVPENTLLKQFTGTTTENNVVTPLHTVYRIVGVKGKSGIRKQLSQA
jgi:hypothetical protein